MKHVLLATALCFSFGAMAQTSEEAATVFGNRLADASNALKAADIYKVVAEAAADRNAKGVAKYREGQALYYYAGQISDNDQRKSLYTRGVTASEEAITQLSQAEGVPADGVNKTDLALAHYFLAINLGKWGQVNGIADSIRQLPKMFKNLDIVVALDETVEEYGAARTRGRVKHKVPAALAWTVGLSGFGKDEAFKELSNGFGKTLVDVNTGSRSVKVSSNSTTAVYILDVLADLKRADLFCRVLRDTKVLIDASEDVLAMANPNKVAEFRNDLNNLKKCLEDEKKCEDADFASGKGFSRFAKEKCR
jgi:hypothetical protein